MKKYKVSLYITDINPLETIDEEIEALKSILVSKLLEMPDITKIENIEIEEI